MPGGNPTDSTVNTFPAYKRVSPLGIRIRNMAFNGDLDTDYNPRLNKDNFVLRSTNTETLSANKTLDGSEEHYHFLDPGGAARDVTLPAVGNSDGLSYTIVNTADAQEDLTVKNAGGTVICYIAPNTVGQIFCDGATWKAQVSSVTGGLVMGVNRATMTGEVALTNLSQPIQSLDPGGADRDLLLPTEASSPGYTFWVTNRADAEEDIIVKEDSDTTIIGVVSAGQTGVFFNDGTAWEFVQTGDRYSVNRQTLAGNLTLVAQSARTQVLDPGGAARDVTLPAIASGAGVGVYFLIANIADALENITVKNTGGTAIGTLGPNQTALVVSDGTTWVLQYTGSFQSVNRETLAGAKTLVAADPKVHVLDPGGVNRNVTLPAIASGAGVGLEYVIANIADAGENLSILDSGATALGSISPNGICRVVSDGTTWLLFHNGQYMQAATVTLAGDAVLLSTNVRVRLIDPGGANRNVDLPAIAAGAGIGLWFVLANIADALENLVVRDTGAVAIATIGPNQSALFVSDGTNWAHYGNADYTSAATVATAGNTTLTKDSARVQFIDPNGAARDCTLPAIASGAGAGMYFFIANTADANEVITIKNTGGTAIGTVSPGSVCAVFSNGTTWVLLNPANDHKSAATTTMSGDVVLVTLSPPIQFLDPNGSARNVDLPAAAGNEGAQFFFHHTGGANDITVRLTGAGATVFTLSTTESGLASCNGTTWVGGVLKTT